MTVEQLIEQLRRLPPDTLVVLSQESIGHRFSPLSEVKTGYQYIAESHRFGSIHYPGEYPSEPYPMCCVLYPN